jgi:hypothetical protein
LDTGIAAHFDQLILLFDNHADLSAVRLRYGADWKQHRYKPIPHLHLENKTKLELTEDMTCRQFLAWMELNLRLT